MTMAATEAPDVAEFQATVSPPPETIVRTIIASRPSEIEQMARAIAQEFDRERQRIEAGANDGPKDRQGYIDFLSRMSTLLNELADAIHDEFIAAKPGQPFFIQELLNAVGADFLRFVKEHRDEAYKVGLFGGLAAFLGLLHVANPAAFVLGVLSANVLKKKRDE